MKSSVLLTLTGVVLLVLLVSPIEARCPVGGVSDCSLTRCTPRQCARRGLECCPKPCGGGSHCVRGKQLPISVGVV
ncbi:secreted salivary gland peptide, putative [Ixodes scapularis]|uniref:Secreted salivary gland peptide, putative n=1 Tax=Ixodes scapularis TaxID=6945 RepID=B7PM68_IXOSC|nr:secreted salivary gland peptide, putative [Ixodes scapularis]|eukprot:XP_002434866.1 secreted salivary gland peptide, putative [Ixodes scapularis]